VNELDNLFERGRAAQRKTIAGILEFASCVKELKDRAVNIPGKGTSFTKDCKREWNIDKHTASNFLAIGCDLRFVNLQHVIPSSVSSLVQLAKLTDNQLKQAVDTGIIKPNTPAKKIIEYQAKLINEEIIANARAVVVQKVNDGIVSIVPTDEQLETALYEHKKEVRKHKKAGELLTLLTDSKWYLKELMDDYEEDNVSAYELRIIEGLGGKIGALVDRYRAIKAKKLKERDVVNLADYQQLGN
jgi:hypothetical protein